jgi:hypothetical protein
MDCRKKRDSSDPSGIYEESSMSIQPLTAGICALLTASAFAQPHLSELFINPPGADQGMESVELAFPPGMPLAGWWFLTIEGDGATAPGTVDVRLDLSAFAAGSNGLLLIRDSAAVLAPPPDPATSVVIFDFNPDIENGANTYILGQGIPPTLGTDLDLDNDGTLDAPLAGFNVADAVAFQDGNNAGREYADDVGGTNLGAFLTPSVFTPAAIHRLRCASGAPGAWVGGLTTGANPGPFFWDATRNFGFAANGISNPETRTLTPGSQNLPCPQQFPVSVTFEQISFSGNVTGDVPDSEYAKVTMEYTPPPADNVRWLNVMASTGGTPVWLIRNLALPGASIMGPTAMQMTTTVDLSPLGVVRGTSSAGTTIQIDIEFPPDPLFTEPPFDTPSGTTLGETSETKGGFITEAPANRGLAEQTVPVKPAFVPGAVTAAVRPTLPNPDVGLDQCSPTSVAQSMHWLAEQYPGSINLGTDSVYDTIEKLKADMGWEAPTVDEGGGCSAEGIIEGKLKFLQRNEPGQSRAQGWRVKYAGDMPASIVSGRMAARRVGAAGAPTFGFIRDEMLAGEDVEIHVGYYDEDGERAGGHSMAVLGVIQIGNKEYLITRDDGEQDPAFDENGDPLPKPDDDTPAAVDGKRPANISQCITGGPGDGPLEGHVYLTGEEGLNRIELVTSESPPNANATTVTDTCIAGNNPVTFSAGVWTKDGVPIGRTFPDGVTLPGGGTASETYTLPDVPNDWHWSATIPRPAGSLTFNFDGFFAAEADIVVPIVDAFVTSPVLTLTADLLVDVYVISDISGPVASGAWSGYPENLPPFFFVTGDVRRNSPAPPPCPGDVDHDGDVDLDDLSRLLAAYGRCQGQPGYNDAADLVENNCIDLDDLAFLLARYGQPCP